MPTEIYNIEDFIKLSEKVDSCQIKRLGEIVKLKIKTPKRLYTIKIEKEKAEGLIKKLKCKNIEV